MHAKMLLIPIVVSGVAISPSPSSLTRVHSVASTWGDTPAVSHAVSTSPPSLLSVNGEGEPSVCGAGIPPSPFTERGDRGVRLVKSGDGAEVFNLGVVGNGLGVRAKTRGRDSRVGFSLLETSIGIKHSIGTLEIPRFARNDKRAFRMPSLSFRAKRGISPDNTPCWKDFLWTPKPYLSN